MIGFLERDNEGQANDEDKTNDNEGQTNDKDKTNDNEGQTNEWQQWQG